MAGTRIVPVLVTDPDVTHVVPIIAKGKTQYAVDVRHLWNEAVPVPEDDTLQEDIEDVTRRLDDILSGAMVPLTDPMFAKINRIRVRFDLESFA